MLVDFRGPDILRVELGSSRSADPLHPNVILSGDYLANTAMFFQQALNWNTQSDGRVLGYADIWYGKTFGVAPIAFVTLQLSSGYYIFGAGEYMTPCIYSLWQAKGGFQTVYQFEYLAYPDHLHINTTNLLGTISAYIVEVG